MPASDYKPVIGGWHRFRAGVEELIRKMVEQGSEVMVEPSTVAIDYWAIVGRPSSGGSPSVEFGSGSPEKQIILRPVLDEITRTQGAMKFYLLEHLRLTSVGDGNRSELRGNFVEVTQRVVQPKTGTPPLADIYIELLDLQERANRIKSLVKLEDGKMVVLGQTGFHASRGHGILKGVGRSEPLMLYFVISTEID